MDYWCALWFWPIEAADELPDRDEWLFDLENLLLGDTVATGPPARDGRSSPTPNPEEGKRFVDRFGVVNFETLFKPSRASSSPTPSPRKRRFFHWELAFADIFRRRDEG
jgi:hypothetical protein